MNNSNGLITRPEATAKYRRSETTIWRDEKNGIIPPHIRIGRRKYWVESQLDIAYGITPQSTDVGVE